MSAVLSWFGSWHIFEWWGKVKLASVGYSAIDLLGKKFCILYALCEQQLSKSGARWTSSAVVV